MYRYIFHQLNLYRALLCAFAVTAILFLCIQCITLMVFHRPAIPAPIRTRLYPGMPLTIDLRPYSLPHPNDLRLSQLTADYHSRGAQACFLIEHLDGGPWWSYVTNEFAEILAHLRQIGRENNITYRSFPTHIALDYRASTFSMPAICTEASLEPIRSPSSFFYGTSIDSSGIRCVDNGINSSSPRVCK